MTNKTKITFSGTKEEDRDRSIFPVNLTHTDEKPAPQPPAETA